jgi:hypothetical protein
MQHRKPSSTVAPSPRFCSAASPHRQLTGEPTLIQDADGHANYQRTFGIDQTANSSSSPHRCGRCRCTVVLAAISMILVASDGKLKFVRNYDSDASEQKQQFWAGMVTL